MTEELISFASKQDMLAKSKQFWNPDKTQFWIDSGVPLVIDRREGYFIYDVEGKRLIDVHLNGGTYNLGHRNPEVAAAVTAAMQRFDIGNHHFPSLARTALAEALVKTAPGAPPSTVPGGQRPSQGGFGGMGPPEPGGSPGGSSPRGLTKVMYGSGGGEAIDIALKSARHATKKRGIVSVAKAYHGHTGLAVATGDERFSTLYLADEVQTGLMRTGELWAISKHGVMPDILVSGKGISGGMYPVSVVLASEAAAGWLTEDGFAHMSTFGGAELGCVAALKTLEITCRPEVRSMVHYIAGVFTDGLGKIGAQYPDWFTGVRQDGLVMGLEFGHPQGAKFVMKRLYENGVWAIFSTLDPRVLQYKPGILLTPALCEELLERTEVAIGKARDDATRGARR